jgi:hypothetical protein
MMISEKMIIYKTNTIRKGVVKVPSYLVDMVLQKNKILMIKSEDVTVAKLDKKNINEAIKYVESRQYNGRLNNESIKYHLIQIETSKTKKPLAQEVAI